MADDVIFTKESAVCLHCLPVSGHNILMFISKIRNSVKDRKNHNKSSVRTFFSPKYFQKCMKKCYFFGNDLHEI